MHWELKKKDLKRYPHFDKFLSIESVLSIVQNPDKVRTNAFFPFIRYSKSYQPFRDHDKNKGEKKPDKKSRLIRYASRRDAYIFSYYRGLISEKYEIELDRLGLKDCVIAYRKIPVSEGTKQGKCNINFAKDAFDRIRSMESCSVAVLDISKYFESLEHRHIYDIWCRLFSFSELPPDHSAVFRNITKYRVVDQENMYERLGFMGMVMKNGAEVKGYLVPYKKIPNQLCSPRDFRKKIAGEGGEFSSIIEKNDLDYGIPQGAPISDIIANFYLIDFDVLMNSYVSRIGGFYMRYSDDILLVVPGGTAQGQMARDFACNAIKRYGEHLQIKDSKCSLVNFSKSEDLDTSYEYIEGEKGKNGLEYLGFRFDGKNVYLRDATLSGLYRKTMRSMHHEVRSFVARYPGKDREFLMSNFNVEELIKKFGRVEDFDDSKNCEDWTFWTYTRRASDVFGNDGRNILMQVKNHKQFIRRRSLQELEDRIALSK